MATEQQIAANRANALRSTGPRTDTGKAASSLNAAKHHLTAKGLIILPGHEDAFAGLEAGLRDTLKPSGSLEEVIYKRAVESAWNLERCRHAGQALIQMCDGNDPLIDINLEQRYLRVQRYARESESSMYRAMRELGKLQAETQFREEVVAISLARGGDPQVVTQVLQAQSQVCFLSKIMRHVLAYRKSTNAQHEPFQFPVQFDPCAPVSRIEPDSEPIPLRPAA